MVGGQYARNAIYYSVKIKMEKNKLNQIKDKQTDIRLKCPQLFYIPVFVLYINLHLIGCPHYAHYYFNGIFFARQTMPIKSDKKFKTIVNIMRTLLLYISSPLSIYEYLKKIF